MNDFQVRIFAQLQTANKFAIQCSQDNVRDVLLWLNQEFGRDWVPVDKLNLGEGILFADTQIYQGYHPELLRYSDAIKALNDKSD